MGEPTPWFTGTNLKEDPTPKIYKHRPEGSSNSLFLAPSFCLVLNIYINLQLTSSLLCHCHNVFAHHLLSAANNMYMFIVWSPHYLHSHDIPDHLFHVVFSTSLLTVKVWILDVEVRMPNSECQGPNFECQILRAECRMHNVECQMPSVECWVSSAEYWNPRAASWGPSSKGRSPKAEIRGWFEVWVSGLLISLLSKPVAVFSEVQTFLILLFITESAAMHCVTCARQSSPKLFITQSSHLLHTIRIPKAHIPENQSHSPKKADTSFCSVFDQPNIINDHQKHRHIIHQIHFHTSIHKTKQSHYLFIFFHSISLESTCILSYWGYHHFRDDLDSFISRICLTFSWPIMGLCSTCGTLTFPLTSRTILFNNPPLCHWWQYSFSPYHHAPSIIMLIFFLSPPFTSMEKGSFWDGVHYLCCCP